MLVLVLYQVLALPPQPQYLQRQPASPAPRHRPARPWGFLPGVDSLVMPSVTQIPQLRLQLPRNRREGFLGSLSLKLLYSQRCRPSRNEMLATTHLISRFQTVNKISPRSRVIRRQPKPLLSRQVVAPELLQSPFRSFMPRQHQPRRSTANRLRLLPHSLQVAAPPRRRLAPRTRQSPFQPCPSQQVRLQPSTVNRLRLFRQLPPLASSLAGPGLSPSLSQLL